MIGKYYLVATQVVDNEICYLYVNPLDFSIRIDTKSEKLAIKIKDCIKQKKSLTNLSNKL
jgi:hypothetical protein